MRVNRRSQRKTGYTTLATRAHNGAEMFISCQMCNSLRLEVQRQAIAHRRPMRVIAWERRGRGKHTFGYERRPRFGPNNAREILMEVMSL